MSKTKIDKDGAEYEEMEGERESGDCDGDKKYIVENSLSPEEIAALFPEKE